MTESSPAAGPPRLPRNRSDTTAPSPGSNRTANRLLAALAAALVVDLVALITGTWWLEAVAKSLLMPLLAGWVWAVAERPLTRPVRWLLVGLVLAWLGDVALLAEGDLAFLAGLGCFLAMQVAYLVAFQAVPGRGLLRARPLLLVPYLAVWLGMNVWLHPGVDDMFMPVLVYSAILLAMAAKALDLAPLLPRPYGGWLALGGVLWVVSDGMLAAVAFDALADAAASDVVVMSTYVAAQTLVAAGLTLGTRGTPTS